jgi:para-nitrobenzyl esterase
MNPNVRHWCRITARICAALAAGAVTMTAAAAECARAPDIACLSEGAVRGTSEGEMLGFRGIPYAQPPLGELRWRPPQPVQPWEGVRDALNVGPMCPQIVGKEVQGAEDCLYVNVWTPRSRGDKPLPVMIWLTGGGNHSLSGEGTSNFGGVVYEGSQVTPKAIVLVTYNLRLGPLGFLAHPALDAERREHVSGNYGSLDQIAMLKWVRRNIGSFGGDPSRVFLFGTSAGGGNICALLTAADAAGLFQAAAMQSSVPSNCEIQTLADAENGTGKEVVKRLGCSDASDLPACLRGKDYKEIITALPGNFSVLARLYGPNVDGHVFPDQPRNRLASGASAAIPIIIGNSSGETREWADTAGPVRDEASYAAAIDKVFGAAARESILAIYPVAAYSSPREAFAQLTTDALFTCTSRRVARLFAGRGAPAYRYLFDHLLENDPVQKARVATHTIEHPFFFGWRGKYVPSESDRAVQRHIIGYWTNMARNGDPNGDNLPVWSAATAQGDWFLEIGADAISKNGDGGAHCDFWDATPPLRPHI